MQLIDLPAGRRAVYHRPKADAPTIVFETGVGADSADWAAVEEDAGRYAGTFRYDRAGRGGSAAVAGKRDAAGMLDELRQLLERAGARKPYLLVGHSFGGLMMRVLAHDMRAEVLGLVLVDSMHPDQYTAMLALLPPPAPDESPAVARMRAYWAEGFRDWRGTPEQIDLPLSMQQARAVTTLGDLPLHVLTSGTTRHVPGVGTELRARLDRNWDRLHADLTALSTRGVHTRRPASGHYMMKDDPVAVAAAIRDVFDRAKSPG